MKMTAATFSRGWLSLVAVMLMTLGSGAQARLQVEGASFETAREVAGERLHLEGAAVFRYLLFKVYAAALYLPAGVPDTQVLDARVARRLEVVYFRDIDATDLARAANTVLERGLDAQQLDALRDRIATLHEAYRDVAAGDRVALDYAPGAGTTLQFNGQPVVNIEGADFARAYFSIWLGDSPMDADLRAALLARTAVVPEPAAAFR